MKDTKIANKKKQKKAAKKKTKKVPAKKLKRPAKNKTKSAGGKKIKESAATKTKSVAKKNIRKSAAVKTKRVVGKKTKKPLKAKTKSPVKTPPPAEEKIFHGEDLHLIPVEGEIHPIDTDEAHRLENIFQNREEFTLRQENQKVKDALGSRKNLKRNFRIRQHR